VKHRDEDEVGDVERAERVITHHALAGAVDRRAARSQRTEVQRRRRRARAAVEREDHRPAGGVGNALAFVTRRDEACGRRTGFDTGLFDGGDVFEVLAVEPAAMPRDCGDRAWPRLNGRDTCVNLRGEEGARPAGQPGRDQRDGQDATQAENAHTRLVNPVG
jgi:hypothetical protein